MPVFTSEINLSSQGRTDIKDITAQVQKIVTGSKVKAGQVLVFVVGSTAGVTTIEYEPALEQDLKDIMEKLVPSKVSYNHDKTWGDANGYSHLRSSLIGPSLTVPVSGGQLTLGTWQQIVVIDFDNRPRQRNVVIQVSGEGV